MRLRLGQRQKVQLLKEKAEEQIKNADYYAAAATLDTGAVFYQLSTVFRLFSDCFRLTLVVFYAQSSGGKEVLGGH